MLFLSIDGRRDSGVQSVDIMMASGKWQSYGSRLYRLGRLTMEKIGGVYCQGWPLNVSKDQADFIACLVRQPGVVQIVAAVVG